MAYDDHLLLQLVNSTVEDVSIKEGVAYDCVLGVLERRISTSVDWGHYVALGVIGLNEIALKKGHRNFVVIVKRRVGGGLQAGSGWVGQWRKRPRPTLITGATHFGSALHHGMP